MLPTSAKSRRKLRALKLGAKSSCQFKYMPAQATKQMLTLLQGAS